MAYVPGKSVEYIPVITSWVQSIGVSSWHWSMTQLSSIKSNATVNCHSLFTNQRLVLLLITYLQDIHHFQISFLVLISLDIFFSLLLPSIPMCISNFLVLISLDIFFPLLLYAHSNVFLVWLEYSKTNIAIGFTFQIRSWNFSLIYSHKMIM